MSEAKSEASELSAVLERDPMRDAFELLVLQWTGRDMAYHARSGTTGIEFAWFCYQKGGEYVRSNAKIEGRD